jgi:hypothetical protein
MLASLSHAVMVQKVDWRSARSDPPMKPGAVRICRRVRTKSTAKAGKNRMERILSRVTLMNGTWLLPAWRMNLI